MTAVAIRLILCPVCEGLIEPGKPYETRNGMMVHPRECTWAWDFEHPPAVVEIDLTDRLEKSLARVAAEKAERRFPKPAPKTRELPAQAYDTIRQVAAEFGGVGYGVDWENEDGSRYVLAKSQRGAPVSPEAMLVDGAALSLKQAWSLLVAAGLDDDESTIYAPQRIITRERIPFGPRDKWPRFSFDSWTAELGVIRGPESADFAAMEISR